MNVEKIIVDLIADTTKFNRGMDDIAKKVAEVMARVEKAAGKDPFEGMTAAARRAASAMAVELQKMERDQVRASKAFLAAQSHAAREFAARQTADFQIFHNRLATMIGSVPFSVRQNMAAIFQQRQEEQKRRFEERQAEQARKFLERNDYSRKLAAMEEKHARTMARAAFPPGPGEPDKPGRSGPSFARRNMPARGTDFMSQGTMFLTMTAANLAATAITSLSHAVMEAGRFAVTAGAHYEVLGIQLETLAGNAEKGKKMMADLMQTAVETPFRVKDVVAAAKELKAFGFETDEVNQTVKALGDISAATGTPMHRLILAFGQTRIAGRLMGQEMRQFVNANVPLIEHLSQVLGKPTGQIKKMIENGQVGFNDVAKALNLLVGEGGRFEGLMDKMSNTVQGRWNSVVDLVEIGLSKVGMAFMQGAGVNQGLNALKEWLKGLDADLPAVQKFGQEVADVAKSLALGFKAAFLFVQQNKDLIASVLKVAAVFIGLNLVFRTVLATIRLLVVGTGVLRAAMLGLAAVSAVTIALSAVATAIGAVTLAVLSLPAAVVLFATALAELAVIVAAINWDSIKDGFRSVVGWWKELFNELWEVAKTTFGGITDAIKAGDWKLAGDIAFAGLEVAFEAVLAKMTRAWLRFWHRVADPAQGTAVTGGTAPLLTHALDLIGTDMDTEGIRKTLREMSAEAVARDESKIAKAIESTDPDKYKRLAEARLAALTKQAEAAKFKRQEPQWMKDLFEAELDWRMSGAQHIPDQRMRRDVRRQLDPDSFGDLDRTDGFLARFVQGYMDAFEAGFEHRSKENAAKIGKAMIDGVVTPFLTVLGHTRGAVTQIIPNEFRTTIPISPGAKKLGEDIQQRFARGVGEETRQYEMFTKNMEFITELQTGLPKEARMALDTGFGVGNFLRTLGDQNRMLDDEQADFGRLTEFDKLKKFVGDKTHEGPPVMLEGSSAAQETVNRAQTQQTSVLENVRTILEQAKVLQEAQTEYQKQTVSALNKLVGGGPLEDRRPPLPFGFVLPP